MSRAYGWRASCPAGGVTVVGVGSGAWFASDFWANWFIRAWVSAFWVLGSELLLGPRFHSSESFAPSRTGIGYWRLPLSVFGYRLISDFILPKSVFPVVAILSDVASRNMLHVANATDEPRRKRARQVRKQLP